MFQLCRLLLKTSYQVTLSDLGPEPNIEFAFDMSLGPRLLLGCPPACAAC